jgi:hypothetical protein
MRTFFEGLVIFAVTFAALNLAAAVLGDSVLLFAAVLSLIVGACAVASRYGASE